MPDKEEEKALERLTPIIDGLKMMDKNVGWLWLKDKIIEDRKKTLDFLLRNSKIENNMDSDDILKGKIIHADSIFDDIEFIKDQYKRLTEEK